jgi:hypothetical protein
MQSYKLEPRYPTNEMPGRCIKCLAEHELNICLMGLLSENEDIDGEELKRKFEILVAFLKSPEAKTLRNESERYLSEGKKVTVKLSLSDGKPRYELELS